MLLDRLASYVEAIGGKVRVRVAEFLESLRLGRQLALINFQIAGYTILRSIVRTYSFARLQFSPWRRCASSMAIALRSRSSSKARLKGAFVRYSSMCFSTKTARWGSFDFARIRNPARQVCRSILYFITTATPRHPTSLLNRQSRPQRHLSKWIVLQGSGVML